MQDDMNTVEPYFPRELATKNDPLKFDFTKRLFDLPYKCTYNLRDDSLIEGGLVINTYDEMMTLLNMVLADNEMERPEEPCELGPPPANLYKWHVFLTSGKFTLLQLYRGDRHRCCLFLVKTIQFQRQLL